MSRSGRFPTGMAGMLALLALLFLSSALEWRAEASGFTSINSARVSIDGEQWVPPGWSNWLARRLATHGPILADDSAAVEALVREIESSPLVAHVNSARVLWPDGLELDVELREPVACLRIGDGYLQVAGDGVLLPGYSAIVPTKELSNLPVIGPNDRSFEELIAGDRLSEDRHLDALAIAVSMEENLSLRERLRLGTVLIDATEAAHTSVKNKGARLYLEQKRLVLFGRSPRNESPGGLSAHDKWRHVAAALELLAAEQPEDWNLLDVRWDRAQLRPRLGFLGAHSGTDVPPTDLR